MRIFGVSAFVAFAAGFAAHAYVAVQEFNQQRAQQFYQRGDQANSNGNPRLAIELWSNGIAIAPTPGAYKARARAYQATNDYLDAVADWDALIASGDHSADTYNSACWARALTGLNLDIARANCDAALETAPNSAAILDSRALVSLKQRRFQDAWNDYNSAINSGGRQAHYLYGRGLAAVRLGRSDGWQDISEARARDPNIVQIYAAHGVTQ